MSNRKKQQSQTWPHYRGHQQWIETVNNRIIILRHEWEYFTDDPYWEINQTEMLVALGKYSMPSLKEITRKTHEILNKEREDSNYYPQEIEMIMNVTTEHEEHVHIHGTKQHGSASKVKVKQIPVKVKIPLPKKEQP